MKYKVCTLKLQTKISVVRIKDRHMQPQLKERKTDRWFMYSLVGLCALSVNHSNSYLVYPGSATIGEITLYDANNLVRPH